FLIYPALILFALSGFGAIVKWTSKGRAVSVITAVFLAFTAYEMVKYHPYENLYFNQLVGGIKGAKFRFEMDYEGSTYKSALAYLLKTDQRRLIRIRTRDLTGRYQGYLFPLNQLLRMKIDLGEKFAADYFMGAYSIQTGDFPYKNKCFSVTVDGTPVCEVFKL
ncbi:MAG: hypothetical protein PHS37_09215, partial [Candidatus Omnitrophica bacterium]|nr:hypothetical protein [Candidatus Omnitrophota bacterium]